MKLDRHISNLNAMNSEMKRIGRMLIANEQGRNLASLIVVPKQPKHFRNLAALVIHAAVVFSSKVGNPLLLPFINMLQNPAALKVLLELQLLTITGLLYTPARMLTCLQWQKIHCLKYNKLEADFTVCECIL